MEHIRTDSDDWPNTGRLMPWLIAAFLAMIFLVPFDSIRLPIPLPVDSTPDRFLLPIMSVVWLCGRFSMRTAVHPFPRTWISSVIGAFTAIAVASVLLNVVPLQTSGDLQVGWKGLAVLLSYIAFFFFVATTIRRTELQHFGTLIVGLACLTAIGTIWEYRTGYDVFRSVTEALAFHGTTVLHPVNATVSSVNSRPNIAGPAQHGLAVCVMMAFALPIAIIRFIGAVGLRKIVWAIVTGLVLAGGIATLRKTAFLLPVAVLAVMISYRPKEILRRALPIGVAFVVVIQLLAPGAVGDIAHELSPTQLTESGSTRGRISDYSAVRPDILNHPLLGRGFGTYLPQENRFIDNEYIVAAITTGIIGAIVYLLIVVAVMSVAHRSIIGRDPNRSGAALAASAGAFAYGIAGFLFDEFGFPQAPYLLFFSAAVVAVAATNSDTLPVLRRRQSGLGASPRSSTVALPGEI